MRTLSKILSVLLSAALISTYAEAAFRLPDFQKTALPNGMQVFVLPQAEVPLVSVQVSFKSGSAQDGNIWGISNLTNDALKLGTKTHTKDKIEETFDFYGARYFSTLDEDSVTVGFNANSADLPTLLPLFADILMNPTFPEKEIQKLREQTVAELKQGKDSPNRIASSLFQRLLFADQPYGIPELGTAESVAKITRKDVEAHYRKHFVPNRAAISIAGAINPDSVKNLVEKSFANWKAGTQAVTEPSSKAALEGQRLLIDKADSRETTFRLGGGGVPRNHKEWVPLLVINTILGGRFTSFLNEELRIKSGYTYGARSGFEGMRDAGIFQVQTFTANKTTFETLELAMKTYDRFLADGFDQKMLDSAKAYVKGQVPPRYETLDALNGAILDLWLYDLSADEFNQFDKRVDDLDLTKARELVKQHFPKDKLNILLIGQAKTIAEAAKKYGNFRQIPISAVDRAGKL